MSAYCILQLWAILFFYSIQVFEGNILSDTSQSNQVFEQPLLSRWNGMKMSANQVQRKTIKVNENIHLIFICISNTYWSSNHLLTITLQRTTFFKIFFPSSPKKLNAHTCVTSTFPSEPLSNRLLVKYINFNPFLVWNLNQPFFCRQQQKKQKIQQFWHLSWNSETVFDWTVLSMPCLTYT